MTRPRLCRICHAPASYVEEQDKPATHIDRQARVNRFTITERVYYCAEHAGACSTNPSPHHPSVQP